MADERRRKSRRRRSVLRNLPLRRIAVVAALLLLVALVVANAVVIRRQRAGERDALFDATRRALAVGDLAGAEAAARATTRARPDDRRALYELALVLEARGRSEDARELLMPEVGRDDGWHEGRVLLAAIAQQEEDYAAALEWLPDGSEGGRIPSTAYRVLAEVRAATGDLAGAAAAYDLAIELDPDDVVSLLGRADLALVEYLDTTGLDAKQRALSTYDAAERRCRVRIRDSEGADAEARLGLAKALMGKVRAQGKATVAEVEAELRTLVADAGNDPGPTLVLADFLRRVARFGEARRVLNDALRTFDTPRVRLARAQMIEIQGETANALAALEQGVTSHPESVELRLAVVDALVRAERFDAAQECVDALTAMAQDDARPHEAAGDLARARARAEETGGANESSRAFRVAARAAYAQAVRLRPRSMPLKKKLFGEQLEAAIGGDEALSEAERAAADRYVDDVLRVNPADADALAWRGRLLLLEDDPEATVALLADAVARPAPTLDLLRLHGVACERTGRDEQSADAFLSVLERLTGRGTADAGDGRAAAPSDWANAVRAMLRVDRVDQAIGRAEAAVRAWPDVVDLRLVRAQARLLGGRTGAALSGLAETTAMFPGSEDARLLLAAVLEREGRTADAARTLAMAPARSASVSIALAGLLGRTGRVDEMQSLIERTIAESDDHGEAHLLAARQLLMLVPPRVDDARSSFEKAAESAAHRRVACVQLADLVLSAAAHDPAQIPAAEVAIQRAESADASPRRLDYLHGKLALLRGDIATAVERLRQSTAGGRPSPAALYYLARALRAGGDAGGAEGPLARALALAPGDTRLTAEVQVVRRDLGLAALADGNFSEAITRLTEASGGRRRGLLLAVARAGLLEFELAAELARDHVRRHPEDREARHVLGSLLLRVTGAAARREAREVFELLAAEDEADLRALVGAAAARLAMGDGAAAESSFRAAHALAPGDLAVIRGVVDALVLQARSSAAIAFVRGLGPTGDARVALILGELLLREGDREGAVSAYVEAAEALPDDPAPLLGAVAALSSGGDVAEARRFLEERIERVPSAPAAWIALAELRLRDGVLDGADDALVTARRLAPEAAYALVLRGEIAAARGAVTEALSYVISADEQGVRDVGTLLFLARLLDRAGKRGRAIRTYERVLAVEPDHLAASNNLAVLLGAEGREMERAIELARGARERAPDDPAVADTLGWLLVQAGRPAAALPLLRDAVAGLDESASVHYHLGLAAVRVGLTDEAARHLERALEIDSGFPDAAAARSELSRLR